MHSHAHTSRCTAVSLFILDGDSGSSPASIAARPPAHTITLTRSHASTHTISVRTMSSHTVSAHTR